MLNAWEVEWWTADPHFGEPTVLFQVHPEEPPSWMCARGSCGPERRRLVVRYVLLWDHDGGYRSCPEEISYYGYGSHWGDNQEYDLRLVMDDADPELWRVENTDFAAFWSSDPPPEGVLSGVRSAAAVVAEFHPVLFFSKGNHHDSKLTKTCEYGGGGDLRETWSCPEESASWREHWHDGPGLGLPPVVGNMAFSHYPAGTVPLLPRGNNVGERDRVGVPFAYSLEEFCMFRWNPWAEPPESNLPYDWWCFYDEFTWDSRHFNGGHRAFEGVDDQPSPMSNKWLPDVRTLLADLDGDTIPNDADACYLDPFDGAGPPWPVAGSHVTALDRDGDGVVNECDGCPDDSGDWKTTDSDGDRVADGCDNCPVIPNLDQHDADLDGIGNACDLCLESAGGTNDRDDGVLDGVSSRYDTDGDGVGDRCDPCPRRDWNPGGWPLAPGWAADLLRAIASVDAADISDGIPAGWDDDGDGVGDPCDNCPTVWNADQVNCNEQEEMNRSAAGWRGWESGAEFRGTGDACDATPCLAECARLSGQQTSTIKTSRDECVVSGFCGYYAPERHWYCNYDCATGEPAEVGVCPVGFSEAGAVEDRDPEVHATATAFETTGSATNRPLRLETEFRGCPCRREERPYPDGDGSCAVLCRLDGVTADTRWRFATNDSFTGSDPPQPVFDYRRTYSKDEGTPNISSSIPYKPTTGAYRDWYEFGGPRDASPTRGLIAREEWNCLTDAEEWLWDDPTFCTGEEDCRIFPRDAMRDEYVWFKPIPGPGYAGFRLPADGNSYIERRDVGGDRRHVVVGAPEQFHPLPGTGKPYLPGGDVRLTNIVGAYSPFVGLLDPFISADPKFMFDEQGTLAGGILTAKWDPVTQLYTGLVGTKLVAGSYDVESSSAAVTMSADGAITAYWLFGGRNADGLAVDGFWVANRATMKIGDGSTTDTFQLSSIPRKADGDWPGARWGAALILGSVAGTNLPVPGSIGGFSAELDASSTGGTINRGTSPTLLLVGGEDQDGLRSDVWMFDGAWRHVGELPGAAGGLSDAGVAITEDAAWLVGGRQAAGPSGEVWRVDLATGAAERVAMAGTVQPAARERPAVAVDAASGELLVFGGTSDGVGLTDLWAFSPATSTWRQVAAGCSGMGCPVSTGNERLVPLGPPGEVAVLADPYGPAASDSSWVLVEGAWTSRAEARGLPGRDDCDLDGLREAGWGARCNVGGDGFPAYGQLRCGGDAALTCRRPVAPGRVLANYLLPGNGPVVPVAGGVGVLQARSLDLYDLDAAGALVPRTAVRLSRPGNDVVVDDDYALVADRDGLTIYSIPDGAELSAVPTCGKARRVFLEGRLAFVLGLRSILVVDIGRPQAPVVLGDYRVVAGLGSAWLAPADRCVAVYRAIDAACDLTGLCGLTGQVAAAEAGRRLYVNLLDSTYVIDFRAGFPTISAPVATGLVMTMQVEAPLLYVNGTGCGRRMYEEDEDGMWLDAGEHDVEGWVSGVTTVGAFAVQRRPGRLSVAERQ